MTILTEITHSTPTYYTIHSSYGMSKKFLNTIKAKNAKLELEIMQHGHNNKNNRLFSGVLDICNSLDQEKA